MHASKQHSSHNSTRQYTRRFVSVRPWQLWVAVAALVIVGIGALPSGYGFIADPSGAKVGIPAGTLQSPLFPNYLIPGLFLFFVNGIGSLLAALALLLRPQWASLQRINPVKSQEWSWTFALIMGLIVMAWMGGSPRGRDDGLARMRRNLRIYGLPELLANAWW